MVNSEDGPIANDLLEGMAAISSFTGIPPRKCYYAVTQGFVPGVWKDGGIWRGLKSEIAAGMRMRARAGIAVAKKGAA